MRRYENVAAVCCASSTGASRRETGEGATIRRECTGNKKRGTAPRSDRKGPATRGQGKKGAEGAAEEVADGARAESRLEWVGMAGTGGKSLVADGRSWRASSAGERAPRERGRHQDGGRATRRAGRQRRRSKRVVAPAE